jgi:predicted ATPase
MIKRVWAKNYRSLANVDVSLEPLTVLVGHNGSGKSNFVDVLRFIYDAFRLGLDAAVVDRHGMSTLRRWSAKGRPYDVEVGLSISTRDFQSTYGFALGSERRGEYRVKRETCLVNVIENGGQTHFETENGRWVTRPPGMTPPIQTGTLVLPLIGTTEPYKRLYDWVTGTSFYNIYPNTLEEPQKPANPYPLDEHGANLASTLRELQRSKSDLLPALENAIHAVIPDAIDFQVRQVGGYLVTRLRHAISDDTRALFELSQESDGTLRMLGILAALYQDPPRTLIALEEPELTIHPGALSLLWEEIEEAAGRSQIIITTHSPDLLDMCRAEYLRVVEKIEGETFIDPIEDSQKDAIQERLFAPGELLRAQGLRRARQQPSLL